MQYREYVITLVTLPSAIKLMRIVAAETEPHALQPVLRQTAKLHLRFGALLVAGWVAASAVQVIG